MRELEVDGGTGVLAYYRAPGMFTGVEAHRDVVAALSPDPAGLAAALQGLVVHEHFAERYGVTLAGERTTEVVDGAPR